jgi:hypothetical protein
MMDEALQIQRTKSQCWNAAAVDVCDDAPPEEVGCGSEGGERIAFILLLALLFLSFAILQLQRP